MTTLQGIAASPGIGIGPVHIVDPEEAEVQDGDLRVQDPAAEQERFRKAIRESLVEVRELREKTNGQLGDKQVKQAVKTAVKAAVKETVKAATKQAVKAAVEDAAEPS